MRSAAFAAAFALLSCRGDPPPVASLAPPLDRRAPSPALAGPPSSPSVSRDQASLELTAVCEPGAAEPSALDVALTLPLEGAPTFRLDDQVFGARGMEKLISRAEASDAKGALPLVRRVATDPEGDRSLELEPSRSAVGAITLRYRASAVAASDAGAREGLRHDATGIGGLGAHFLVLPDSERVFRTRVAFRPAACPPSQAETVSMSTFGAGPDPIETTGTLARLRMASYFTGHPKLIVTDDGALHMRSAWFGHPSFDAAVAGAWAARAFSAERAFFRDEDPAPYQVFVRVLPAMGDRANGMGQPSSLLSAIGPRTPFGPRLRTNLAHEMLHRWIGLGMRLAGPEGDNFWFSEGFTVYYGLALMLRAGLVASNELASELDDLATRHFSNERSGATNDEIRRGFFEDDALSVVPYTRGSLYAAELDAAIRRRSGGARSLDDVVRDLYRAALATPANAFGVHDLPANAVRDAVLRELGQPGVDRFDAVIVRGGQPDPPSDAFGPCFARERRSIPRFQLGFDERKSRGARAIRGLVAGSAAARAGLVENEPLVSVEAVPLFPEREVRVTVARGGTNVVVRYLPANPGPRRDGFTFRRAAGVAEERCRTR